MNAEPGDPARADGAPSPAPRVVLHVDLDAFFASVAQLDDPSLVGKPLLIGGTGPRAVVLTASYEARPFGCRSAMPMAQARRLCPQAIVVKPNGPRVREISHHVREILGRYSPLVQPVSVDEAYLDVTGSVRLFGDGERIGQEIRRAIREETGVTASVGVAPNKFLAKIASDLRKPDALVVIRPDEVRRVLDPLPVSAIHGVGPAAQRSLERLGVRRIEQLAALSEATLTDRFGSWGARLYRLARGIDDRPVHLGEDAQSIGHEQTFGRDVADPQEIERVLLHHVERVGRRLREKALLAGRITVKIRFGEFQTITRADTLDTPTDRTDVLWQAARTLFRTWAATQFRPVRLIGVSAGGLVDATTPVQGGLFEQPEQGERRRRAEAAVDAVARKFGPEAIRRAGTLRAERQELRSRGTAAEDD